MLPTLIIPAYQPDPKVVGLVDELIALGFERIIVVDDGCTADRASIFDALRCKPQVTLLSHAVNLGKGAALKLAFNYTLVTWPESAGVVTLDADGQHLPADVLKVAQALLQSPQSLTLGAREFKAEVPLRSRFGNITTGYVFHFLVGRKLKDTQTGLRGIPAALMRELLPLTSGRYEFELDMLITAARKQVAIAEVSISTVYEDGNKSSHFNPLVDSLRIYFVFLRFSSWSLITYGADLLVFTLVFRFSKEMFASVVVGRAVGAFVSIFGARNFVFKSDKSVLELSVKFFLLWLTLLGLSYGLMILFVRYWHMGVYFSRILVDSVLFFFNFLVQRDFIFGSRGDRFRIGSERNASEDAT